ncbi:hypothetical protein L3Y34_005979 [Caenorhabditis briggsae]|uniref:RING-type domain-containing protein n=1 Tax=Caenorhabditis briggsae TaxID=6238 RepID=A0AAE8ZVF3_CAEBR|nr:hypothetical protein L3Y34_005979 [Caenorhabditis briggsae]
MYTSWNYAHYIVNMASWASHFMMLFFVVIFFSDNQSRNEKSQEILMLPPLILIAGCVLIYSRVVKQKIWRGELSEIEAYFIGFKVHSTILTYSGVIFNLIVCCFGTIQEVYIIFHSLHLFMNFSMLLRVLPSLRNLVMNTGMHKKHLRTVLMFHVAGIIILPLLTQDIRSGREISAIFINQVIFMSYSWNIADYLSFRDGGLEFRELEIEETPNDIDYESDNEEDSSEFHKSTGSICGVCYRSYCDSIEMRTPRILNKCGHTTCRKCAGRIIKNSVNRLPKNYGLLEVISDMKQLDEFYKSSATENSEPQRRERRNSF